MHSVHDGSAAPRACTLIILPLVTLAFPLGVLLVVLQRLPAEEVRLASTDARLLQPLSTFWCSAQEVSSGHPFYAYKVPKAPAVLRETPHKHLLAFRFNLNHGTHYMLRYHLLAGSTLELAGCTNGSPSPFDVFLGTENWTDCLQVMTKANKIQDSSSSEEDEDSFSDSNEVPYVVDRDTHSNVQAAKFRYDDHSEYRRSVRGVGRRKIFCQNSILSGQLNRTLAEEDPSPACPAGRFPFSLTAARTGRYYVVVRTDGTSEPGGVLLHLRLNRTTYELPESVLFCRSPEACAVPLGFGAEERVVVFVSAEPDAGAALFRVQSKCQPRAAFYLVVFLLLPVLFALALLYFVRFHRRRRRGTTRRGAARTETREGQCPAPVPEAAAADKPTERLSRPPSYADVVGVGVQTPESTPPPSYEELLRQPLVSVHRV